ncbi:MAG: response regulator [Candidatus Omnitrophica bacterium]|nr:response regulator [Candidatus Omnitrophota bacterium]
MIKLLIVDDEQAICKSIQKPFEYLGFTVFTATTAAKALSILEKKKPKIVFLDILMPDADGLDLLKKFKEIDPGIIVIMVTAKGDDETREKAIEYGADEFMTKPFGIDDLRVVAMEKIGKLLDKSGHMQKPRMLIVDDEKKARDNLKNFISPRYECDIEESDDGKSAIDTVKKTSPDIIFLDVRMPGISGIDVISKIKEISPQARIIVISAYSSPDVAVKAMGLGAFTYLDKPIDFKVFQERLESALMSIGKLMKKS